MSVSQIVTLIGAVTALVVAVTGLWSAIRAHQRINNLPSPPSPGGRPSPPGPSSP